MNRELILRVAKFRDALEKFSKSTGYIGLDNFPHGACADSSLLLAKYLKESGIYRFCFITGKFFDLQGEICTHAWLEKNDLVVDITSDQFSEISNPVFIIQKNAWYEKFEIENHGEITYEDFDSYTKGSLANCYNLIASKIN